MKNFLQIILFMLIFQPLLLYGQPTMQEYDVKSVYIYNFSKYIDHTGSDTLSNFVIGVLGDSPIVKPLQNLAREHEVNDRTIDIRHWQTLDEIENCHFMFIAPTTDARLDSVLTKVQDWKVLTIADTPGYAAAGVAINFVVIEDKVRFELNFDALNRAKLNVSSKLVKLAILVDDKRTGR